MTDKPTKILLAAIAAGLWLNAGALWRPTPAQGQNYGPGYLQANALPLIAEHVEALANGTCTNRKLC